MTHDTPPDAVRSPRAAMLEHLRARKAHLRALQAEGAHSEATARIIEKMLADIADLQSLIRR